MPDSKRQVAVPWYVGKDFHTAPPGHRYLLYLPFWSGDWNAAGDGKQQVLKELGRVPAHAVQTMYALAERQRKIGVACGAEIIDAVSVSPFATGLGWEHPNENGFAFLHPYGLPYLAGSGVKGVVRCAAQQLAKGMDGDTHGWDERTIDALFGLEPPPGSEDASRGALRFFDVIPEIAGNALGVDIMNPHYGDYYRGESTPHDAGKPIPIFFLVVPPGSRFLFVVDCPRQHLLPEDLRDNWRGMIRVAFQHAFDWLGFGAKTAVGYGAFETRKAVASNGFGEEGQRTEPSASRCAWVDETLAKIVAETHSKLDEALRGKRLAEAWRDIQDPNLKQEALQDIRRRWEEKGWWSDPSGKAAKQAKAIYESNT